MSNEQKALFANNLKRIMAIRGKTQTDLADGLGRPLSTVSGWYNGHTYPRVNAMQAIADYLNVSMVDLISDETQGHYSDEELVKQMQEDYENPETRFLMDARRNLSKKGYAAVKDFIQYQLKKEGQLDD